MKGFARRLVLKQRKKELGTGLFNSLLFTPQAAQARHVCKGMCGDYNMPYFIWKSLIKDCQLYLLCHSIDC